MVLRFWSNCKTCLNLCLKPILESDSFADFCRDLHFTIFRFLSRFALSRAGVAPAPFSDTAVFVLQLSFSVVTCCSHMALSLATVVLLLSSLHCAIAIIRGNQNLDLTTASWTLSTPTLSARATVPGNKTPRN